ncbi:hypothetical protein E2C01_102267 [Portunus trituberculatus]|uniref:Uncharacterized protein n=1 Tax=Portunus trituberculatus TaxID=210409 RepID=A0A5B7KCP9_PORTR|nr:hypothetical protein [Portunus trituberculatus]
MEENRYDPRCNKETSRFSFEKRERETEKGRLGESTKTVTVPRKTKRARMERTPQEYPKPLTRHAGGRNTFKPHARPQVTGE